MWRTTASISEKHLIIARTDSGKSIFFLNSDSSTNQILLLQGKKKGKVTLALCYAKQQNPTQNTVFRDQPRAKSNSSLIGITQLLYLIIFQEKRQLIDLVGL